MYCMEIGFISLQILYIEIGFIEALDLKEILNTLNRNYVTHGMPWQNSFRIRCITNTARGMVQ